MKIITLQLNKLKPNSVISILEIVRQERKRRIKREQEYILNGGVWLKKPLRLLLRREKRWRLNL
jgi:hypothetical protein